MQAFSLQNSYLRKLKISRFFFNFQQNLVKKFNYLFEELRQDLAQYIFLSALISTISTNFNFFFKVCCSTAVDSMSKIKKQNQPKQNKKSRLSYKENYQRYDYAMVDSYSNTV